jgi:multiple antibiotic resistance protein
MDTATLIKLFGAFFAIMNPFVNLPIFLSMTNSYSVSEQRQLALKIAAFSVLMCLIILFAGKQIIGFFGISIDDFRVAGGLVLASIAWSMLHGNESSSHHGSEAENKAKSSLDSIAFYPMTFPMIVGPGTIATIIIYARHAKTTLELGTIGAIISVILLMLYLVFFFSSIIGKVLTETMRVIMTRLMGMILLAIAVEMLVAGLKALF